MHLLHTGVLADGPWKSKGVHALTSVVCMFMHTQFGRKAMLRASSPAWLASFRRDQPMGSVKALQHTLLGV